MGKTLITSTGKPIQLGRELGKGGEGTVFEVPGFPKQVAKLYKGKIDQAKQAKLAFMASHADDALLNYAAWPQETLHESPAGPVIGFLMPKVTGRDPIHNIYSPAHRRQERPNLAWDFLLFVARNTAAAFETLHTHGHVLGDVNQGNVMVGSDSKVVLIDCDSFQITANKAVHFCEVGVSHFTPPELQGLSTFRGVTRSANHDNFGLALLIFHLLFGGRHPFSGKPLRNEVGEALESDIKAFRYAYAVDGQNRGIAPPPNTIPMNLVPDSMGTMFHLAFTERGATGNRPTAHQWVAALDSLRPGLRKCGMSSMHRFPGHLSQCPWCAMESKGIVYFIDLGTAYVPGSDNTFILAKVWALIEAVQPPPSVAPPNIANISASPQPLPASIPGEGQAHAWKVAIVIISIVMFVIFPDAWFVWAIAAWIGWASTSNIGASEREEERRRRQAILDRAQKEYENLVNRLRNETGPGEFQKKKQELANCREEYKSLPAMEKAELDKLHATAEQRQKHQFLDKIFIEDATISGVGPTKKAALRSFGIETAADVEWNKVRAVKGFGDVLTRVVVDWRKSCERRFVFNPRLAISAADVNSVRAKIGMRKKVLETTLSAGPAELNRFRLESTSKAKAIEAQLAQAATKYAQAKADMSVV
ncbi:helix-hairpin-helix domain-containing protein [Oxalobacteraceae bacterium R-40]|uniref:Helix-hairpin-helix domain-containing protein n=1 Tax=Keguizhuia sedimenti TaxID=3064264 RepID=A0ABU1BJ13_9BURK|nr:helix-hairpin-helix domain-containing protein [Oxalobacteraceae bacterium R-40]